MNVEKVTEFYSQLEALATYNNETISEEDFFKQLQELKADLLKFDVDIPKIFELVRTKKDFRKNMQAYGGYEERREKLREEIYPIIDLYDSNVLMSKNNKKDNLGITAKEINSFIKSNNMSITCKYGKISFENLESKSGGNGFVLFGKFQKKDVALKFLTNNNSSKMNRFLCEFGNVIVSLNDVQGIVRMFFYDEVLIGGKMCPFICMKKYDSELKYDENRSEKEIIDIFKQILQIMQKVHNEGIVHRDLKPQNILISNGKIYIGDFGIAYYNPQIFDKTGNTTKSERLANFDFSAPEQRNSIIDAKPSMDIYAIGQILQWLVYGQTLKGTHRKKLYEKYNSSRMKFLDSIVDKCLDNNKDERYQSIEEINSEIQKYNNNLKINNNESSISQMIDEEMNKKKNFNKLKANLTDTLDKICFSYYDKDTKEKNFILYNQLIENDIIYFLNNLSINLEKLEFFENVGIFNFLDKDYGQDNFLISKYYYQKLAELYEDIKRNQKQYLSSFIKYVEVRLNENVYLPF